jgi:hypothetical protein
MPDSLYPCTESKPARRQPGEHCKAMRWRSHVRDFSAPVRGVQPRLGFAERISFAASFARWQDGRDGVRGPNVCGEIAGVLLRVAADLN